jgi:AraC-like DNA-binding protein
MNWTEEYTSRQIKKLFGKGFSQLLNDTRLSNAKWLLSESTLRIKDVAAFSGFYDSLYFSRVFRKNFQISPSEYRKKKWP